MREVCLLDQRQYGILSNNGSFDNFIISYDPDTKFNFDCARTSINNLLYSEAVLSHTQAGFYYVDKDHSQTSIPKSTTPPSATSATSAQKPTEEFTYSCAYCRISKYESITSFNTSDLLE